MRLAATTRDFRAMRGRARVGQQHRVQITDDLPQVQGRPGEQRPVFRRTRIHQHQLAGFLNEVEVRDPIGEAMNSLDYFRDVTNHEPVLSMTS
jgi:hypothetical protein